MAKADQMDFGPTSLRLLTLFIVHSSGLLFAHTAAGAPGLALAAVILPFALWFLALRQTTRGQLATQENLDLALASAVQDYRDGLSNAALFLLQIGAGPSNIRITDTAILALQDVLRPGDICVRQRGGRVAVCARSIRQFDPDSGQQIAERLLSAARSLFHGRPVFIGGCLISRSPIESVDGLTSSANRALEESVARAATGICTYSKGLGGATLKIELVDQVKMALTEGQIRPAFQPQVDIATKTVIGAEALARWHHPEQGTIPPMEFLAAVKSAGQWAALTDKMLSSALNQLAAWDRAGLHVGCVGVNFSETDLAHPMIIERVAWALDSANLPADRLAVEVLETVAADPEPIILQNVQGLADLGCKIDIDDFGTGHAAISTLRKFPAHRIKVDRSFISGIDRAPKQQDMLDTIILMANRLGLETLAEGVENDAEQAAVLALSCTQVQGFGIARPMPVEDFENWYHSYRTVESSVDGIKVA